MPMLPSDQTVDGFHCYTYIVEITAALGDEIHIDAGVNVPSLSSKQAGDETSAAARHRDRLADRTVEINGDEINRAHELAGAAGSATKDAQSRGMKIRPSVGMVFGLLLHIDAAAVETHALPMQSWNR